MYEMYDRYEAAIVAGVILTASAAGLWSYRSRLYRDLGRRQSAIRQDAFSHLDLELPSANARAAALPNFNDRLAVLPQALPAAQFARVAAQIERLSTTERSYLPTHKKGGTVAYETLCKDAPGVVALYLSAELHDVISSIVGARVVPTPLHDQSSCSVLFYERPGDHIGWHYDHNFYKGRHFTVLLPILNRNAAGTGLSAARLVARIDREERQIATPPNSMVVFEGARVLHKATPIADGERRVVLSMTFSTDPRNSALQGMARRIKDTAFFGIRALWT